MPTGIYQRPAQQERFWAKVNKTDGCWLWTGGKGSKGYGSFWAKDRLVKAHRFAYELLVGTIPVGFQLDHLCRNRACVRAEHLEVVTNKQNALRGISFSATNARLTVCKRGHPFDLFNTYFNPKGGRYCRQCNRKTQIRKPRRSHGTGY